MSVFKRPNGKWVAQVYDPVTGGSRQVGTFSTRWLIPYSPRPTLAGEGT